MANIPNRDAKQTNYMVTDVYVHRGYNSRIKRNSIECFQDSKAHIKQFYRHAFFSFDRTGVTYAVFFARLPRIMFLGEYRDNTNNIQLRNQGNYFTDIVCEYGFHVFLDWWGTLNEIYCYAKGDHRMRATNAMAINDIIPRFDEITRQNQPILVVGIEIPIYNYTNLILINRCGAAHDFFIDHNADKYTERKFFNDMNEAFGIYVGKGTKLVLEEWCRRCEKKALIDRHHWRTLVMSGGFLMVEGMIRFQFAKNGFVHYNKEEVEIALDIPIGTITNRKTPIFFLNAIKSRYGSQCWSLHFKRIDGPNGFDQWILTVPENATFEVHSYHQEKDNKYVVIRSAGICGVQVNQFDEPWFKDGYRRWRDGEGYLERIATTLQRYIDSDNQVESGINPRVEWRRRARTTIFTSNILDIHLPRSPFIDNLMINYARIGLSFLMCRSMTPTTRTHHYIFDRMQYTKFLENTDPIAKQWIVDGVYLWEYRYKGNAVYVLIVGEEYFRYYS